MGVRIGLGLAEFPFSSGRSFWRWVRLCEEGGVDSLWHSDRLVGPTPFLECMSVMAALAGATERLKFGMNVLSLGFREPLIVAKECATIDFLSGGRLLPAFGVGSPASQDWRATGSRMQGQGARMDQALEIIARLWLGETVSVDTPHFKLDAAHIRPLPVQRPLPMWIGGSSLAAIRRTALMGTGWLAGLESPAEVAPLVAAITAAAIEAGRPIDPEHFGAGFFYRFGANDDAVVERRRAAFQRVFPGRDFSTAIVVGGVAEIVQRLEEYRVAGITKFVLRPLGENDDDIDGQTRRLIEEVIPAVHRPGSSPLPNSASALGAPAQ